MESKRGLAGWAVVFSAMFVWIIVVALWYEPDSALNLADKTNLFFVVWWTIVCAVCAFVGFKIERNKDTG